MPSVMTPSHHSSHMTVSVISGSPLFSLAQLNKQGTLFHAACATISPASPVFIEPVLLLWHAPLLAGNISVLLQQTPEGCQTGCV